MMGTMDWFTEIIGAAPDGDVSANARIAKALVRAGLAVVIIEPNTKKPACTLLARESKKADTEAQEAAKANGSPNWTRVRHSCGVTHAITDEKTFTRKRIKDLLEAGANLAIAPGKGETQVMAIDLDTDAQREAFLSDWFELAENELDSSTPLTVTSPGVMNEEGEWIHKNGGHFWMPVPEEITLPERPGRMSWCACHKNRPTYKQDGEMVTCPKAWAVYWGSSYVLVPPSVRPEGAYRLTGESLSAPKWLIELIQEHDPSSSSGDTTAGLSKIPDDPIDAWSAATSWSVFLEADNFTPASYDTCGCQTWTRPGAPAHTKSVTAHEPGCTQYDTSMGHGPLRIWSDALGAGTISKLKYVARFHYDEDMGAAMTALGIERVNGTDKLDDLDSLEDFLTEEEIRGLGKKEKKAKAPKGADEEEEDDTGPVDTWKKIDLTDFLNGTRVQPVPTLLPREDGNCLVYPGKIHSFHGESESGKSLILMWEAVRLMMAGEDVLWITFDSDLDEDLGRAIGYGCPMDVLWEHMDYRAPDVSHAGSEGFIDMFTRPYALAVIDGVTDALNLLGKGMSRGDPNDAYTQFSRIFPRRLAEKTGAAIVLIDHVNKDADNRGRFAIGAQAKMSQLTGAAYLVEPSQPPVKGGKGSVTLRVAKDRPAGVRKNCGKWRQRDRTQEAACIEIDDTGEFTQFRIGVPVMGDPFAGNGFDRPEQQMIHVCEFLANFPQGMTTQSIKEAVNGRNERVNLALDLLEAEGYIEQKAGPRKAKIWTVIKPYTGELEEVIPE
jgi:hypothetical protein